MLAVLVKSFRRGEKNPTILVLVQEEAGGWIHDESIQYLGKVR